MFSDRHGWDRLPEGSLMRRLLKGLACCALATGVATSGRAAESLSFLVQPEPTTLLAQINTASQVQLVSTKIFDGLFGLAPDLSLRPALALSHEISADGRMIGLKLREGVRWHDGKPFTSADVRYTLMTVIKQLNPRGRSILANLEVVDTPDDRTAILRFSKPSLYVLKSLTGPEMPIMPAHVFENSDVRQNPAGNAPVGTGPFRFERWDRGSAIVLSKNPDYWTPASRWSTSW